MNFSDLEDLDAEPQSFLEAQIQHAAQAQEPCRACGGSGQFHSKFTGRIVGECFRCQGTGSLKAGSHQRIEKTKAIQAAKAAALEQRKAAWMAEHQDVCTWIFNQRSGFANSLATQLQQGPLTIGQVQKVREIIQEALRAAAEPRPLAAGLDLRGLPDGSYAVPDGETRLKLKVKRPKADSKWFGYIFVSDAAEYGQRTSYGRQAPGRSYEGRMQPQLKTILADPKGALAAYGQLTGTCGVCGRALEDETSVALGIGPICRAKLNF